MVDFSQQALALTEEVAKTTATPWLNELRQNQEQQFKSLPWPTRKTELWKYTSLFPIAEQKFNRSTADRSTTEVKAVEADLNLAGLETHKVVFVNGQFNEALSDANTTELGTLVKFNEANADQQSQIQAKINKIAVTEQHIFASLNGAMLDEGVFWVVPKNTKIEKPLQIVHITTDAEQDVAVNGRVLVVVESGAEATLVEQFIGEGNVLVNTLTEIEIGDNAKLNHYRLQQEHEAVVHFGGVHVDLLRDSQINSFYLGLGGKIKRIDIVVNHLVGGSHCEMSGVYLPQGKQHIDFHSTIEHEAAHCTTNEVFRGIMADESKAVFNGRIHIHKDAQKTLAELSNKNLLLSNKAEINTKPELEIYADDVRCAHGATVSQLNDEAMFYLKSRGISKQEAEVMLSFGFINELLNNLVHEEIQQLLRPQLANLFGKDAALTRHLV